MTVLAVIEFGLDGKSTRQCDQLRGWQRGRGAEEPRTLRPQVGGGETDSRS